MLVQAGRGAVHDDHIGLTVTGQVHELRAAAQRDIGFEGDGFEWGELCLHLFPAVGQPVRDRAEIALVEPGAGLLGEDAGDAFTVQVGPAIGAAVQADGKVLQTLRIDLLHRVLHDGLGVFELDGWQAALVVAAVVAAIAGLGDLLQEGVDRVANVCGV